VISAFPKKIAKYEESNTIMKPTREVIPSLNSVKTIPGLPKSAKQYMNTSTVKATIGTCYYTIESMKDPTWKDEYPKLTSITYKLTDTTYHSLGQLQKKPVMNLIKENNLSIKQTTIPTLLVKNQ